MSTAQLIRQARRASSLTQRSLASRAGITQPAIADMERSAHDTRASTLSQLLNAAGYGLFTLPTASHSAADWADYIYQELKSPRSSYNVAFRALIGFSDDLSSVDAPLKVALCVSPPAPCGDSRFDAGIAAIANYYLSKEDLPIPAWVNEPSRILKEAWIATPYAEPNEIPISFKQRGVLLALSELASV